MRGLVLAVRSRWVAPAVGSVLLVLLIIGMPRWVRAQGVSASVAVGAGPVGLAVNPETNLLYVASYGANTVSVIDLAANAVRATIPVATWPWHVAVNPVTNTVYVSHVSGVVSVIDGATNAVAGTVSVGAAPQGIAVNPATNRVYVANGNAHTVSVIDGASRSVVATVTTGNSPQLVAVNADTGRVYVGNYTAKTVTVVDGATNSVVTTLSLAAHPTGLTVNPTTNRLYVARYETSILVLDGATNATAATIGGAGLDALDGALAVDPTTNTLVASGNFGLGDATVVIDGATNSVVATVLGVAGPVAVNPDSGTVYVTHYNTDAVSVITGTRGAGTTTPTRTGTPPTGSPSPTGTRTRTRTPTPTPTGATGSPTTRIRTPTATPTVTATMTPTVTATPTTTATPTATTAPAEVAIGPEGGRLRTQNDEVQVDVPAGALSAGTVFRLEPRRVRARTDGHRSLTAFSLTAGGGAVRSFGGAELLLMVRFDPAALGTVDASTLALYVVDGDRRERLPSRVEPWGPAVIARTSHLSEFELAGVDAALPAPVPAQVVPYRLRLPVADQRG